MRNKYFTEIKAPDLKSSQYGSDIKNVFFDIDQNFQKIITLPFLKGENGDSIKIKLEYLWDTSNIAGLESDNYDNCLLTEIGKLICDEIFHKDLPVGITYKDFKTELFELLSNFVKSDKLWDDSIGPKVNPSISVYYIETENKFFNLGLPQPFYFLDPRLEFISDSGSAETNLAGFEDLSCFLHSDPYEDIDYENLMDLESGSYLFDIIRMDGWPTIYYKNGQFCWKINGIETGINAQGVKGEDGDGSRVWVARCNTEELQLEKEIGDNLEPSSRSRYLDYAIDTIFLPDRCEWVDIHNGDLGARPPRNGDMVILYVTSATKTHISTEGYVKPTVDIIRPYTILGIYNIKGDEHFVTADADNIITANFDVTDLNNALNFIGQTEKSENQATNLQGLYLPTPVEKSEAEFRLKSYIAHSLYTENYSETAPQDNDEATQVQTSLCLSPLINKEINTNNRIEVGESQLSTKGFGENTNYLDWDLLNNFYKTNIHSGYFKILGNRTISSKKDYIPINQKASDTLFQVLDKDNNSDKPEGSKVNSSLISGNVDMINLAATKEIILTTFGPTDLTANSFDTKINYFNIYKNATAPKITIYKGDLKVDFMNIQPQNKMPDTTHFGIKIDSTSKFPGVYFYTTNNINDKDNTDKSNGHVAIYSAQNELESPKELLNFKTNSLDVVGDTIFTNGYYNNLSNKSDYIYVHNYANFNYDVVKPNKDPLKTDLISHLHITEAIPTIDVFFRNINNGKDIITYESASCQAAGIGENAISDSEIIIRINAPRQWYETYKNIASIRLFRRKQNKWTNCDDVVGKPVFSINKYQEKYKIKNYKLSELTAENTGDEKNIILLKYPLTVYQILKRYLYVDQNVQNKYFTKGELSLYKVLYNGCNDKSITWTMSNKYPLSILGQKKVIDDLDLIPGNAEANWVNNIEMNKMVLTNGFGANMQFRLCINGYRKEKDKNKHPYKYTQYKFGAPCDFKIHFGFGKLSAINFSCSGSSKCTSNHLK